MLDFWQRLFFLEPFLGSTPGYNVITITIMGAHGTYLVTQTYIKISFSHQKDINYCNVTLQLNDNYINFCTQKF